MQLTVHKTNASFSGITCSFGRGQSVFLFRENGTIDLVDLLTHKFVCRIDVKLKIERIVEGFNNNLLVSTADNKIYEFNTSDFSILEIKGTGGLINNKMYWVEKEILDFDDEIIKRFTTRIIGVFVTKETIFVSLEDNTLNVFDREMKLINESEFKGIIKGVSELRENEHVMIDSDSLYYMKEFVVLDKIMIENPTGLVCKDGDVIVNSNQRYQIYTVGRKIVHKANYTAHCDNINGFIEIDGDVFSYGKDSLFVQVDWNKKYNIFVKRIFEEELVRSGKKSWLIADGNKLNIYEITTNTIETRDQINNNATTSDILNRINNTKLIFEEQKPGLRHLIKLTTENIILDCDISNDGSYIALTTNNSTNVYEIKQGEMECVKKWPGCRCLRFIGNNLVMLTKEFELLLFNYKESSEINTGISCDKICRILQVNENTFVFDNTLYNIEEDSIECTKISNIIVDASNNTLLTKSSDQYQISQLNEKSQVISTETVNNIKPWEMLKQIINQQYCTNERYLVDLTGDRTDLGAIVQHGSILSDSILIVQLNWEEVVRKGKSTNYQAKYGNK
ncbi:hypothetical protein ECANGB1_870 [Enterospora canceri]|uniref:Uncharacterized protein n=1 Tax=Enterospora canceri TaxID=1081671 RepID=A0A1Y1S815_9MICR|nr:hypothetical protein ECANGB1_870 [Enterospora canceri]